MAIFPILRPTYADNITTQKIGAIISVKGRAFIGNASISVQNIATSLKGTTLGGKTVLAEYIGNGNAITFSYDGTYTILTGAAGSMGVALLYSGTENTNAQTVTFNKAYLLNTNDHTWIGLCNVAGLVAEPVAPMLAEAIFFNYDFGASHLTARCSTASTGTNADAGAYTPPAAWVLKFVRNGTTNIKYYADNATGTTLVATLTTNLPQGTLYAGHSTLGGASIGSAVQTITVA